MNNTAHTEDRICQLIPESSPSFHQLRLYLNSLLKTNNTDTTSPIYHPPLDWPEPTITQDDLALLHNQIAAQQLLSTLPIPAYLASLGLAQDQSELELAMAWAAMNSHVLLKLAGMHKREAVYHVLCTRFRLPLSTPNSYNWLWSVLPPVHKNWQKLTDALVDQQQEFSNSTIALQGNAPRNAQQRIKEIRDAYEIALTSKAKIFRGNSGPIQKLQFPNRLSLTPKVDSRLHKLSFPIKRPVPRVSQEEQRFDAPQTERIIDISRHADIVIQDSATSQAIITRLKTAHIARRSFELYSEPSILLPAQVQALFRSLYQAITVDVSTVEEKQADTILLLSLLTGTAAKDLMYFKKLFSDKYIVKKSSRKRDSNFFWKVNLELPNAGPKYHQHNLESGLKFFYLPLPPSLNAVLTSPIGKIEQEHIAGRLKTHSARAGIALLSNGRISSALHTIIRRQTQDQILADLICGYSPRHSSALYYCTHKLSSIIDVYRQTISFLSANSNFSLDYLDVELTSQCGSQSLLKADAAADFMNLLLQDVEKQTNPIKKHNALTCWLWYVILLLTSIRPVNHIPGMLSQIDLDTNLLWVSDKEGRNTSAGRVIPICDFLNKALTGYLSYIDNLKSTLCLTDPWLADILYLLARNEYPLLFFRTEKSWEAATPSHILHQTKDLPIYPLNWTRHFGRSFLIGRQPDFIINAAFGHEEPDQEALNPFSSMPVQQVKQLAISYDELANSLNLKTPKNWCRT